ncbi:endopeptidase La [Finegoldia sp. BIOML-A3]|uniref:endopeptidase La n=1 Tax=unclassified Finegoldia TaxID=2619637 RepID=UPI0012B13726|nr:MULTISPECIES: endopeptidase La [unclassified Finegoldia]MSA98790.1 endopeptidase La [Finegoldia sp. BIOML-A3]MSB92792.1 endopeptidase La [Finegoldia sp. BIOML-A4]
MKEYYTISEKKLPIIALRGLWLFPNNIQHFEVGREVSLNALNASLLRNSEIFICTQKDPMVENITKEDFYHTGVLASIKQTIKMPNGNVRVLVEAYYRAKIVDFVENDSFLEANVEVMEYDKTKYHPTDKSLTMIRMIISSFESLAEIIKKPLPQDLLGGLLNEEDPSSLIDTISMLISLNDKDSILLLETLDMDERIELVYKFVIKEIEFLKIKEDIEQRTNKEISDTQKEYFLQEQLRQIKMELGEEYDIEDTDDYANKVKKLKLKKDSEEHVLKEINRLSSMNPNNPESTVIRNYIDQVLDIPWNKKSKSSIDLKVAEKVLNDGHFGLEDVKKRILEYLAVKKMTGSLKGPILCLVGPPGVGKTSIARSIAEATNRKFVSMRLGGVRDEAEIRGHRKTYIGAMPGRIITQLQKAKKLNPVFLLDEIDKLASDFRGDPASALLEVLDPEQNSEFTDNYIEIPVDLSDVLFITTANSQEQIPDALLDRMEVIRVTSYTDYEKFEIANRYLLPRQLKENGMDKSQFHITRDAIYTIINNYTRESGVRELERNIGKVVRKAVVKIVRDDVKKVVVNNKNLEKFLGSKLVLDDEIPREDTIGVVNGLAWTQVGGVILTIEANVMDGSGKTQLTGKLGDVMKESAMAAISYIRSNQEDLGIKGEFYKEKDIHIHVPEGAVPKDGPSAGVTMVTALVSALTGRKVKHDFAMTGEITLTGRVLAIGGVKEKVLAAHRYGINKVFLPKENKRDIQDIDPKIRQKIKFYFTNNVKEILDEVLI